MGNFNIKEQIVGCYACGIKQLVDRYIETESDLFLMIAENFCMSQTPVDFRGVI